jgi:hypothetical protein
MKIKFNFSKLHTAFEAETCSRCGGSGQYSYCQRYGTTCFKCAGAKRVFTKRGQAAYKFYSALLSKRADQLMPGNKFRDITIINGSNIGHAWFKVLEVVPDTSKASYLKDGVMVEVAGQLKVSTPDCDFHNVSPDRIFRVASTRGQKLVAKHKAMEYQLTLSKTGKVKS